MKSPIISVAEMREWEKASWNQGRKESAVIEQVGACIARRLIAATRYSDQIVLLAGKGNNGNDVRAMRPHLSESRNTRLIDVRDPRAAREELETCLHRPPDWIVDGLFGIGLNRPLDAEWQELIHRINQTGSKILSVDTPSGLNVASGQPEGAAIQATVTVTLGAVKYGLLAPAARDFVGRLELEPDIGLIPGPCQSEQYWIHAGDFADFPPPVPVHAHKGTFGHLGIVAGSMGFHGAAVLAARGASMARPGLVTLQTEARIYQPVAAQLQSAMVRPWSPDDSVQDRFTALMAGPGLAASDLPPELREALRELWRQWPHPMIVDASAMDWMPQGPAPHTAIRVLTPHPGEAARLLATSVPEIQKNRPGAAREISSRYGGCWVILKGCQTIVAQNHGPLGVNSSGNPGLAQGGSGDILSGFLAGLLAQPRLQESPRQTLAYAVWNHGHSADLLQESGQPWSIEDLPAALGRSANAP